MHRHDFDSVVNFRGGDGVKWNTYPADVLPMWVADSDFSCPEPVLKALQDRIARGAFGYSVQETPALERAAARWMRSRFAWDVDPAWVAFSPSVVSSFVVSLLTYTSPGDHILFMTPAYPPFFSVPRTHGRRPVTSSLIREKDRYVIDFDDLKKKMADPGCRMLVLCNPHNPTGRVFTREELLRLGDLCLEHNLLIFSDEIHCDYVFPGHAHIPFPSLSPALAERTLVAINPSKTFNMADIHTSALICANPGLLERFKTAAYNMTFRRGGLGTLALTTAYNECAWYADQATAYIKGTIDMVVPAVNADAPGIRAYAPEATYLLWLDCRGLNLAQGELERFFLEKAKLALVTGTAYGREGNGFMRMNLACRRETAVEALARLTAAASGR